MNLLVIMLEFSTLLPLHHLTTLEVSRGYYWLPSESIFASDKGQFEVVSLIHFGIFRTFSNGCGGKSLLVPKLLKQNEEEEMRKSYL